VLLIFRKPLISLINFLRNLRASLKMLLNQEPGDFGLSFPTSLSTPSV
jgi:hypothetical protein